MRWIDKIKRDYKYTIKDKKVIEIIHPTNYWGIYVYDKEQPTIIYPKNLEEEDYWYWHAYSEKGARYDLCFEPKCPFIEKIVVVLNKEGWITVSSRIDE